MCYQGYESDVPRPATLLGSRSSLVCKRLVASVVGAVYQSSHRRGGGTRSAFYSTGPCAVSLCGLPVPVSAKSAGNPARRLTTGSLSRLPVPAVPGNTSVRSFWRTCVGFAGPVMYRRPEPTGAASYLRNRFAFWLERRCPVLRSGCELPRTGGHTHDNTGCRASSRPCP